MATKKAAVSAKAPAKTADVPQADLASAPEVKEARVKGPTLRIKSLVDRVSEATGGKKKGVKEIVEATLAAIGDALGKGEELNLPGFGRTRIARTAEKGGASMMTLKIRRAPHRPKGDAKDAKVALADDEDDS
jgi:nucleoid DNA-binding protein